jgi:hypothetical protein
MDREIKRLLKLSSIPNFKLTEHEQAILDEWKRRQEPVEVKKRTYTRKKKTTNEVKEEEKETGELEVEHLEES